jgi:hypothetical protein
MRMHPSHSLELYKVRQQAREAEARMVHIRQPVRGGSKGHKSAANLGCFFASLQIAVTQAITGRRELAGNNDIGQHKAA